jgi:hypothetical protein
MLKKEETPVMQKHHDFLKIAVHVFVSLVGAIACDSSLNAQGVITFGNLPPAAIYDVDGKTPLAGAGFLAELYAGPAAESLSPVGSSITPFLQSLPGYFFDSTDVAIPGVPPGGTAVVQVVAWRASDGATFAIANHAGAHVGSSSAFQVGPLGSSTFGPPPPELSGMQSFSLYVVPEPSVLVLGFMGIGSLILLGNGRRADG